MLEKFKNMFKNKEKRVENLVFLLCLLIITLLVINRVLNPEESKKDYYNEVGVELAKASNEPKIEEGKNDLEKRLENILSKINGVGDVSVLITYSESSSIVPVYNSNLSTSTVEEKDTSGGSRITETENNQKEVVTDSDANVVLEKTMSPKIEGAIIIAKGAESMEVKTSIISAVEAVTGIATHKIQVFKMGE